MILLPKNLLIIIFYNIVIASCRIHKLSLTDDERHYVDLSTFGFFQRGILEVKMYNFKLPSGPVNGEYGFTLDRTINDVISQYLEGPDACLLHESENMVISPQHPAKIFLKMDFVNLKLNVTCKGAVASLNIKQNMSSLSMERNKRQSQYYIMNRWKKSVDTGVEKSKDTPTANCVVGALPITSYTRGVFDYYNVSFAMYVASSEDQGLYNLHFHKCLKAESGTSPPLNTMIEIYESNDGNFLSAGEMPLPALYTTMSLIFFLSALFWTYILKTSKHPVYKIHIVMCVLVYLKALSLAFHGINYHFIQIRGEHVTAWAILYYITHLLKGAVLFVTIVLVGTGWNFIKHILADRDKKLFMVVIPMQVVANVAQIIIEESEKGSAELSAWRCVFVSVDLLCCGAILFPVVWSIRHLQDASTTDGKAAINLRKLILFRHFYIMVVCYIYFTRIIVYPLITVPFQYWWIDEMFRHTTTFVFFVMTGYKFRPAAANPYFTPNDVEADQAVVLSKIGVLEGVTKVPHRSERKREDTQPLMQETNYDSD